MDDCLVVGTAGKTIEGRLKEEIVMHRLKQVFAGCEYGQEIANDPCGGEWQCIVKQLNEPACYV